MQNNKNLVWDRLIRITHWSLALAIIANLFFINSRSNIHNWIGFFAFIILWINILWTLRIFIKNSSFLKYGFLKHLKNHITQIKFKTLEYFIILSMQIIIILIVISGYFATLNWNFSIEFKYLHKLLANIIQFLFILHLVAVLSMSFWFKKNLIKAMITGKYK